MAVARLESWQGLGRGVFHAVDSTTLTPPSRKRPVATCPCDRDNKRMVTKLALNREQSRQVDKVAIDDYGMSGLVLMENAGRGCVDLLERLGIAGPIGIVCGKGNNGGDGFVIARHLWIRGYEARVVLVASADELAGDAAANFEILRRAGANMVELDGEGRPTPLREALDNATEGCDWLVDCLLGTGAAAAPRPPYDTVIEWMNAQSGRRLAVDVPSGLDCDTGARATPTVRANFTATFVTTKIGYQQPSARPYVGEVHVVDIGIPPGVVERTASV